MNEWPAGRFLFFLLSSADTPLRWGSKHVFSMQRLRQPLADLLELSQRLWPVIAVDDRTVFPLAPFILTTATSPSLRPNSVEDVAKSRVVEIRPERPPAKRAAWWTFMAV